VQIRTVTSLFTVVARITLMLMLRAVSVNNISPIQRCKNVTSVFRGDEVSHSLFLCGTLASISLKYELMGI
jgi:hypothetical protein